MKIESRTQLIPKIPLSDVRQDTLFFISEEYPYCYKTDEEGFVDLEDGSFYSREKWGDFWDKDVIIYKNFSLVVS